MGRIEGGAGAVAGVLAAQAGQEAGAGIEEFDTGEGGGFVKDEEFGVEPMSALSLAEAQGGLAGPSGIGVAEVQDVPGGRHGQVWIGRAFGPWGF